ncbi:MAG: hypothetical protein K2H50_04735 [Paramuribaculum sp.]|nr:hypothetical protein [Paramuribaculum sp.]
MKNIPLNIRQIGLTLTSIADTIVMIMPQTIMITPHHNPNLAKVFLFLSSIIIKFRGIAYIEIIY